VYRQYQNQVSRRDLQALTETVRRELAHQRQAQLRHITWHVPAWSGRWTMRSWRDSPTIYCASIKCRISPRAISSTLGGERVLGETVAGHLEQLFLQHGRRWCSKRDNGSNLNQQAVDEVLARYLVMPLNSPPHYPPYNGGMECAVRELKTPLVEKILTSGPIPESQVQVWAEVVAHELNHRPRPCLDGQVACRCSECKASSAGVYSPQAKGDLRGINELTGRSCRPGRFTLNVKPIQPGVWR